jgi:MarR family transcriptional regulator for hemolysin
MQQLHHGPLPPGTERQDFLERQPTYWLKRCYQALRRTVDQSLREYGLTLSQRDVLLTLYEEGPLDQGMLRERLGLEQSSVSRLVDGLVRRGLVELQPGEDRRVRIADLSDQGKRLLLRTPGSSELGGAVMVAGLTLQEQRELVRLLRHCSENLMVASPVGAVPSGRSPVSSRAPARRRTDDRRLKTEGDTGEVRR